MKIGFIGLGIMGSRMAQNLQDQGHEMIVYNRTRSKAQDLLGAGASWADSSSEVVDKVDVFFTMLESPEIVEKLFSGKNGIGVIAGNDKLWIDCSTVNPSFTKTMSERALEKGFRFLDAPVAGSKAPAAKGELIFLVGGDQKDIDEVSELFSAMGTKTIRVGGHGQGASMKIVINLMLAQTMAAFSECAALGISMGLSQELLFDVLLNTPVVPPYLSMLRPKLEAGDTSVNFPLRLIRKDLQLVAETAYENAVSMPSANIAKELYTQAFNSGLGDADFSSIFKYLND